MAKNIMYGNMNSEIKMIKKWFLSVCILFIGLVSCDPRNTYYDSLVIVNGTGEPLYVVDIFGNQRHDMVLLPDDSCSLYSVAFDDFTYDSPFLKFISQVWDFVKLYGLKFIGCIKQNGGGKVSVYSLDDNSQPDRLLIEWDVNDVIVGHHLFREESLKLKSESSMSFEWLFTILPEDLEQP